MRWLARYFLRRVAVAAVMLVAGVLLTLCGMHNAHAMDYGDQGEAYVGCLSTGVTASKDTLRHATGNYRCDVETGFYRCMYEVDFYHNNNLDYIHCGNTVAYGEFHNFPTGQTCSNRNVTYPPGDAAPWYTPPETCIGGCRMGGESFTQSHGGVTVYGMRNRFYTGDVCQKTSGKPGIGPQGEAQEETKPKKAECTALGNGQTGCVKPNGDHCATSSTGKTFCWTPTETGKKVDGEDAQVKSKKGDAVTPPDVVIQDKDWQRKEGYQSTACVNNTCTTFNVTNFSTVPAGSAKNSTGDNSSDGTGNTSGNGASSGNGGGQNGDNSEGDSASDSGNCDTPPICVGDTLKCLHLKYTWKIECNSRHSEISKGDGCGETDVPVCAGTSCKAEAYAGLVQQWKQRCAMQALGEGMASRAAGISNGDDAGVVDGIWNPENSSGIGFRTDLINVAGAGGALLPDVEIEGQHWNIPQGFFDAIAAVRVVIIAMCTVIAMFAVGRNI